METKAHDVCMVTGADKLTGARVVTDVLLQLTKFYAPETIDAIYQGVAQSVNSEKPTQTTNQYLAEFHLLPRRDGGRMRNGGPISDASKAAPGLHGCALPTGSQIGYPGETVGASEHLSDVGKSRRRPTDESTLCSVRTSVKKAGLIDDGDSAPAAQEAYLAHPKASKKLQAAPKYADAKPNPIIPNSGNRGRRYSSKSGYHLLPRCPERGHRLHGALHPLRLP